MKVLGGLSWHCEAMPRSDAMKPNKKGAQGLCKSCAPFVRSLCRVWADGVQGDI